MNRSVDAIYEQVRQALGSASAYAAPTETTPISSRIRVLALRTPTLPPAAHTNAYMVGPLGAPTVVVDPGSPYPDEQARLLAAIDDRCAAVLLTHHHGDHVGGAQALADRTGAPIVAHEETARLLDGIVRIDRTLADGETFEGIIAIFTPGHARGHLVFEITDDETSDRFTIAGDMVAGIGTILIDPSEGDMAIYFASLEKMLARPASTLLPAHGPAIPDGHGKLREYLAHRKMREARVLAAVVASPDATARELVAIAYADTPAPLWVIAERSLLAHLAKLVAEGRVVTSDATETRYSPSP